jgi:hypothetical protein
MAVIARGTKINSSDRPLTAVGIAYATPPFPPFFHPPIGWPGFDHEAVSTGSAVVP